MYRLIRCGGLTREWVAELPAFGGSLLLAERCFHFHSFTLECCAFLGAWLLLGALLSEGMALCTRFRRPVAE